MRAVQQRMSLNSLPAVTVIVGGTNGKGSVVALLESIYLSAGYSVGSYTSPHLVEYNERVRINGETVSDSELCAAFNHVEQARGNTALTYFEFGTLAAADILRSRQVDMALMEVGLGGRLDAVNVFDADVAVVTSVGIDHSEWLGDDRESIGKEKAGIFRSDRQAICGDENPPDGLVSTAHEIGAVLKVQGKDFSFDCGREACQYSGPALTWTDLPLPVLSGSHQHENTGTALMVVNCLESRLSVSRNAIDRGIRSTHLPARFQEVRNRPNVVLDVAHNPDATQALAETCSANPVEGRTVAVVGMMKDKALSQSLEPLANIVDDWYCSDLPAPRGASAKALQQSLTDLGKNNSCQMFNKIELAFERALQATHPEDRILVFGSFVSVGAIMRLLD